MGLSKSIIHKLILTKGFSYYPEDEYLIQKVLSFTSSEKPCVLDVGCGNGHYSFMFKKSGATVVSFDYNVKLIEENLRRASLTGSSIRFMVADGNYPEKFLTESVFDIIFMSSFSPFAIEISRPLMKKHLDLLTHNGILVFIQNSDLGGDIRKTNIRNYSIAQLTDEFSQLDCNIEKVFFYDRHIIGRVLRSYVFSDISTVCHRIITQISSLPCNIVMFISQKEKA